MHIFTPDEINALEWTEKKKIREIERIVFTKMNNMKGRK